MKWIVKVLCFLLVCVLFSSLAVAEQIDLKWGMSPDEVTNALIRSYPLLKNEKGKNKQIQLWGNVKISKYNIDMYADFADYKLYAKIYETDTITSSNRQIYNGLMAALKKKYGKPLDDTNNWNKKKINSYSENVTLLESAFLACPIDELYNSPYHQLDVEYTLGKIKDGKYNMTIWEPDEETYISLVSQVNSDAFTKFYVRLTYVSKDYVYGIDTDGL